MKARNYGDRYSGGDAYAMGRELNAEMIGAWRALQFARSMNYPSGDKLYLRYRLDSICRIRRAARGNAIREVVA